MSDTDEVSKPVLEGVIERGPRGRFVKGNPGPPEGKKRKKGQLNKNPSNGERVYDRCGCTIW